MRWIPSLLVSDIKQSVAFYRQLGFSQTGTYQEDDREVWAEVTLKEVSLWLYTDPPMGTLSSPALSGVLYVRAQHLDLILSRLGDLEPEWGPETMSHGMREVAVRDPDGYLVAFTAPGTADHA